MTRRITATLVTALMLFAAMPVLPAAASANSSARLVNNQVVYPGSYTYQLSLTNNEVGLLGTGKAINYFVVTLPQSAGIITDAGTPTAGSFKARKLKIGKTYFVEFSGSTLAPGSSLSINVPAVAVAPSACDVTGAWTVRVSSDGGASMKDAAPATEGALDTRIQVLEILNGSLKPVAPTNADNTRGVTDRTGTAGQTVTYEYQVRNHAANAQNVTAKLTSSDASDKPGAATSKSIAGQGGTATVSVPVTLGSASAQRVSTLTAAATGSCASAPVRTDNFTVQVPVDLQFSGLAPVRVRSGVGSATTFTTTVVKSGGPAFDMNEGTLSFGSNNAVLQDAPKAFVAGNQNQSLRYAIATINGAEGTLGATIVSKGVDANLAPVNLSRSVGGITIDITAPKVAIGEVLLPRDFDGDQQIAVKNGDTITVKGTVLGTDLASTCPSVKIVPNAGAEKAASTTCTDLPDGSGKSFTATLSGGYTWDATATAFKVSATALDTAGNEGAAAAPGPYIIDLALPELGGYANQFKGLLVNPTTISVQFEDNTSFVRGGCDPTSWSIDGVAGQVKEVRMRDGRVCTGSAAGADEARRSLSEGIRVLVLEDRFAKEPHETPTVTYAPGNRLLGAYPTKDGATNDAVRKTIETVNNIIPPLPSINAVERKDGSAYEPAYLDAGEGAYYTNAGGEDGVRLSWSFTTKSGALEPVGYRVRVTDAAGKMLAEVPATGQNKLTGTWTGQINVPLGSKDGQSVRRLYVVSPNNVLSEPNSITLVLDTVLPTIAKDAYDGANTVTMTFTEKIVAGSEFATNWFYAYSIQTEQGTETARQMADSVEVLNPTTRKLTITSEGSYLGIDYFRFNQASTRYEDRAGNLMADTISAEQL